jgi:hypothetical protein
MSLAAALVAIAEKDVTEDLDRDVVTVARKSWGALGGWCFSCGGDALISVARVE